MIWSESTTTLSDSRISTSRFGHCAAAVEASDWGSNLVVVYGGVGSHGADSSTPQTALSDVVVLQVDSGTWTAPEVVGPTVPGPRAFHCAATIGRHVYVFGGHILAYDSDQRSKKRTFFNDMWRLDTATWQWAVLAGPPGPQPPKRDMCQMAPLLGHQLLLFGGRNEQGRSLGDTWVYNINSCTWSQVTSEGAAPPPRRMHAMVECGSSVVMWGGERDNGPLDDLWILQKPAAPGAAPAPAGAAAGVGQQQQQGSPGPGLRWMQLKSKAAPAPRFGHAMVGVCPEGGGSGRLVVFGGCLDQSSFLSLVARNYVQTREMWTYDMGRLNWYKVEPKSSSSGSDLTTRSSRSSPSPTGGAVAAPTTAAAGAGGPPRSSGGGGLAATAAVGGPPERMCHTLTCLSNGRVLLLGGRNKDGICHDSWWLDQVADHCIPPSPRPSNTSMSGLTPASSASASSLAAAALEAGGAADTTPAAAAAAATPPPAKPAAQASLLQSLFSPMSRQQRSAASSTTGDPPAAAPAAAPGPGSATPLSSVATPTTSQPPSPRGLLQPLDSEGDGPAKGLLAGADSVNAPLSGAGAGPSASLLGTPLRNMMAAPGTLSKLISNQLSNQVTSTVNSFLEGQGQLRGSFSQLSRLAPSFRGPRGWSSSSAGPTGAGGPAAGAAAAAAAAAAHTSQGGELGSQLDRQLRQLRIQMGLPAAAGAAPPVAAFGSLSGSSSSDSGRGYGPLPAPDALLQELTLLGQQLLNVGEGQSAAEGTGEAAGVGSKGLAGQQQQPAGGGAGSSAGAAGGGVSELPPDVLLSAARQHLMSGQVEGMSLKQLRQVVGDYQHLLLQQHEAAFVKRLQQKSPLAPSQGDPASRDGLAPLLCTSFTSLKVSELSSLHEQYRGLLQGVQ